MRRSDVIYLVAETPAAHGIFDAPKETQRMVYVTLKSVGLNEYYRALEQDLRPEVIFVLSDYAEYRGEKIAIWNGKRYRVVRAYQNEQLGVELTVEEATVDG